MTVMATTILMPKRERETGGHKSVNQTCTEVVLLVVRATDLELGEALTHGRQNPERAKSGGKIRATDFRLGKPLTHGGATRILDSETSHPREAKILEDNLGNGF